MSGNLETISNPSIDNPSPRPLGNDPVEEILSQTPTTEHDPPPVQQACEEILKKRDLYKENPDIGEEESRKQATNDPPSQSTLTQAAAQEFYDWNSHLQQFDFENRHHTPGMQSPVQRMKTLTHSVYKRDLHIVNDSMQSQHINLDKHTYPYFQTTHFYHPNVKPGLMHDSFVNYLQFILSIPNFPPKLKSYLELGQMNLPHLLVNAFGGSFTALAQRLCGISPSYFLYNNQELVKKLILFSRSELQFTLKRSIPLTEWKKRVKG